jgi:ankyrin repeat protein
MDAGIDIQGNYGQTALMMAAVNGETGTAKALIEMGAGIDIRDNRGETALMIAESNGETETEKVLIAAEMKLLYKKLKSRCHKFAIPIIFGLGAYLLYRYNRSSIEIQ